MTDELVKRYDVYPAYHSVRVEEFYLGEFVYYADHANRIEALTAERDRLRIALTDAESYLGKGLDKMAYNILRAALKGETP